MFWQDRRHSNSSDVRLLPAFQCMLPKRTDGVAADLIPDCGDILHAAFIAPRPDGTAVCGLDELCRDAHPSGGCTHCAFEPGCGLIGHVKPWDIREGAADSVGEGASDLIVACVLERQYGD